MLDVVTPDEIRAVATRLLELAKDGDVAASRLVLSYAIGKPSASADPDTLDLAEWHLFRQQAIGGDEAGDVANKLPVTAVCRLIRTLLPVLDQCLTQELVQGLRQPPPDLADQPEEEVILAQPHVPRPEDVLPQPRPRKRRRRREETMAPDASPVRSQLPAESERPAAAEQYVVTPLGRAVGNALASSPGSTEPATPRSPASCVPGYEQGTAASDSATSVCFASATRPTTSIALPPGEPARRTTGDGAAAPARAAGDEQSRPSGRPAEEARAGRRGGRRETPVSEPRLHWLLRQLGLTAAPPLANGANGREAGLNDDSDGH
jgi:hypothetical protein